MSKERVLQATEVQESFHLKLRDFLKSLGIDEAKSEFLPGRESCSYKVSLNGLLIYIYDDGGAEILSNEKVDRLFKVFPKKIDWRFEVAQYVPQSRLENEFFSGLKKALDMVSGK